MPIRPYAFPGGIGVPDVDYYPAGNLYASGGVNLQGVYKAGDVLGLLSSADAARDNSPAGCVSRKNNNQGQAAGAASFPLTTGGGILGIVAADLTVNASGVVTSPSPSSTIDPSTAPVLAVPSRTAVLSPSNPIAGVRRTNVMVYLASDQMFFVQRHKKGTRVNQSLVGALANLTWNTTTLEFEVDSAGGATNLVEIVDVPPMYGDNRTWYDSSTFATDAYGGWVVFKVLPAYQAANQGLRYAGNT